MNPRWNKVWRDLWANKSRTIVVVLAIAVGVMAFSSVFITRAVLLKDMNTQYTAINPSSVILRFRDGFEPDLVNWIETQKGVKAARATGGTLVRIFTPQGARNVELIALNDYDKILVNQVTPETGSWPPQRKELIFERRSALALPYQLGDDIEIETPKGRQKTLNFAGTVHDLRAIPANLFPQFTAYVSFDTIRYLDESDVLTSLEIQTDDTIKTKDKALALGNQLKKDLENRGFEHISVRAEDPNKHWSQDVTSAFVMILTIIGAFSLVLSLFLVFNTVSAIVVQQKKQIGIMKAIGAKRLQISILFLAMALSYGFLSLLVAIPVGALLGYGSLAMVTNFLNLEILDFHIPPMVLAMETGIALVVPVIAALIPIIQGTKITVREAISDYVVAKQQKSWLNSLLTELTMLSRPMAVSLRNTFRQKGRLILTLVTLTIAGTLFVSVIGVRSSMVVELNNILELNNYDMELYFDGTYDSQKVTTDTQKVEGVAEAYTPLNISGEWQKNSGSESDQKEFIPIQGYIPNSQFSLVTITRGRNLQRSDSNQIIISNKFLRDDPSIEVGKTLTFTINDKDYDFEIVGVYLLADTKMVLVNSNYLRKIVPDADQASSVQIKTTKHDSAFLISFAKTVEESMKRRGYDVAYSLTIDSIRSASAGQFDFLVGFLMMMAALVAVVGGLGLAGTMSLNVLERTREIGVMRSIGASNSSVFRLVIVESLSIGFISWLIAVPLSVPVGLGFCYALGTAFFEEVLPYVFSPVGMLIWLVLVIVIAVLASIAPAKKAVSLTVRDTLSYE
ncbi:FtsX-like permease family protein [Candidatus Beckwithbacteria bacterium]|nr:FtsX-like permease family protein [Candidatus Beckwithbacteria bacterium]